MPASPYGGKCVLEPDKLRVCLCTCLTDMTERLLTARFNARHSLCTLSSQRSCSQVMAELCLHFESVIQRLDSKLYDGCSEM